MDSSADVNKANAMNQNYPPPHQPPPTHMPPGLGYPVAPYQGGYVSPYQPYGYAPSAKHCNSSPSFNMNYGTGQNYGPPVWPPEQNNNNINNFGRLMLGTMATMVITMCMISLVIWFLFGTEVPGFHVAAFSVSNLNITSSMVQADWEINVTVLNPNPNLHVHSGPVHVEILYNNFQLATSSIDPFTIEGSQQIYLNFKLVNQNSPCKEILTLEMQKQGKDGAIPFSVRLGLAADFFSSTIWRKESLKVFCEDLKLNMGSNGNGTLDQYSSNECFIFA